MVEREDEDREKASSRPKTYVLSVRLTSHTSVLDRLSILAEARRIYLANLHANLVWKWKGGKIWKYIAQDRRDSALQTWGKKVTGDYF